MSDSSPLPVASSSAAHSLNTLQPAVGGQISPHSSTTAYTVQVTNQESASHPSGIDAWIPPSVALAVGLAGLIVKWNMDKHQRRLATKEKIYLKAMEALHDSGVALGQLSNPNLAADQLMMQLGSHQQAISQAEIVAGMPLVKALSDLRKQMFGAVVELVKMRIPVDKLKIDIESEKPIYKQLQENIEANLTEQRRINIDGGHPDPQRFRRLQSDFAQLQQMQSEISARTAARFSDINAHITRLTTMVGEIRANLISPQADVMQLIREELKELGENFEKATFLAIKAEEAEAAKKAIHDIQIASEAAYGPPPGQHEQTP